MAFKDIPPRRDDEKKCSVDGCDRAANSNAAYGMCNAHYKRKLDSREMHSPIQKKTGGWISSHGYRYLGKKAEHRAVMESILGRPLEYNDVVHHKDGNHLNNAPENLEVLPRGLHIKMHTTGKTNEDRALEKEIYGYCLADALDEKPPE